MSSRSALLAAAAAALLTFGAGCGEQPSGSSGRPADPGKPSGSPTSTAESKLGQAGPGSSKRAGPGRASSSETTGSPEGAEQTYSREVPDPGMVVAALSVPRQIVSGRQATAVFQTRPRHSCQLELQYPDSGAVDHQRLEPAVADETGKISWTWTVSKGAADGEAKAYVVCSGGQRGDAVIKVV